MLFGACGGKTSDGTTSPTASATIGSSGGILRSIDGQASLQIPLSGVSAPMTFTITGVAEPSIPGATVIGPAYAFGPAGTVFTAAPATITIPYGAGKIGMEMYWAADGAHFKAIDTWTFNGGVMTATTQGLGTFVVAVPESDDTSSSSSSTSGGISSSSSGSGFSDPACVVTCEGPTNVDGGIGCDCTTTCKGVTYTLQCRCGMCTCDQNGYSTAQTTVSIDACSNGAEGLRTTYNSVCGYPSSPNQGGGGGPTSNDAGGHCE